MSEPVTVIFITAGTTPERTDYAVRTITSVRENLRYPDLRWFVADDGSSDEHLAAVVGSIPAYNLAGVSSERNSYGGSCNRGIAKSRELGRLMFFLEDDWELYKPLDLWGYAATLMERDNVGMIRMGYLNEGVSGKTVGHRGILYWELKDDSPYIFAGHPSLRHIRFHDHAGDYPEKLQPGETELGMAWRYKTSPDPRPSILWPCDLGQSSPFGHIGSVQSYIWNGGVSL